MKSISFLAQYEAERLHPKKFKNAAIISITSPGNGVYLDEHWNHLLAVEFDDIVAEKKGYRLFDKVMALQILNFVEDVNRDDLTLIVHCWAGVSRSRAVAKAISEIYRCCESKYRKITTYNELVYNTLIELYRVKNIEKELLVNAE